uniref:Uncharacterized protein n=1 Tax=Arion vulgaris TaxID=1028688 RepID=A0A0B6Y7Q7_9EUPU
MRKTGRGNGQKDLEQLRSHHHQQQLRQFLLQSSLILTMRQRKEKELNDLVLLHNTEREAMILCSPFLLMSMLYSYVFLCSAIAICLEGHLDEFLVHVQHIFNKDIQTF